MRKQVNRKEDGIENRNKSLPELLPILFTFLLCCMCECNPFFGQKGDFQFVLLKTSSSIIHDTFSFKELALLLIFYTRALFFEERWSSKTTFVLTTGTGDIVCVD